MQKHLNQLQTPTFDVLLFGDKGVGKKCFMDSINDSHSILLKKTKSRDEHFQWYDYIKKTEELPNSDQ